MIRLYAREFHPRKSERVTKYPSHSMSRTADPLPRQIVGAIKRRDWTVLTLMLHPYLHWTRPTGEVIRGRKNVLAYLAKTPIDKPPVHHELRDGQIYRWFE